VRAREEAREKAEKAAREVADREYWEKIEQEQAARARQREVDNETRRVQEAAEQAQRNQEAQIRRAQATAAAEAARQQLNKVLQGSPRLSEETEVAMGGISETGSFEAADFFEPQGPRRPKRGSRGDSTRGSRPDASTGSIGRRFGNAATDAIGQPSTIYGGVDPIGVAVDNFTGIYSPSLIEVLTSPIDEAASGIEDVFNHGFRSAQPQGGSSGESTWPAFWPPSLFSEPFVDCFEEFHPRPYWAGRELNNHVELDLWEYYGRPATIVVPPISVTAPALIDEDSLANEIRGLFKGVTSNHPTEAGGTPSRVPTRGGRDVSRVLELMDGIGKRADAEVGRSTSGASTGTPSASTVTGVTSNGVSTAKPVSDLFDAIPSRKP
jgi:hypothetical protein